MKKTKIIPVAIATLAIGMIGLASAQTVTDSATPNDSSARTTNDSMNNQSTVTSRDDPADDVRSDANREANEAARDATDRSNDAFDDDDSNVTSERMARNDRN